MDRITRDGILRGIVVAMGFMSLQAAYTAQSNDVFPYAYEIRDLDNGLRVIVVPTDFPDVVSLQIPVQVGSRDEVEPGKTGFAHFFEHMMFRGSENYTAEEYMNTLRRAGVDQNAFTSDDFTNYHLTFSREDLETILQLEADRFIRLDYSEEDFRTEARAILGEYNTSNANPLRRLLEAVRDAAFDRHTYKHMTLGTLEDIQAMPEQYEYSLEFYDQFYRPENTALIIAGAVEPHEVFELVERYWGDWEPGAYAPQIPDEPDPSGPRYTHIDWESPTLPLLMVAFRGPSWSESQIDMHALHLISSLAFSNSSPLYQKLVIDEQRVDQLFAYFPDQLDPQLLYIIARVADPEDIWNVRDEIYQTLAEIRSELTSSRRLEDIKSNMRYSFANGFDNSQAVAEALVQNVARTRDPESLNRSYAMLDAIEAEDIREVADEYFTDDRLVVATLSQHELPAASEPHGSVDARAEVPEGRVEHLETVLLHSNSPLIDFRIMFNSGAAADPEGMEGLAHLTAAMISNAGSRYMRYSEIEQSLYPMAGSFTSQVDKEMTVFSGRTHRDNLDRYYEIVSGQLLNPGWREEDFERVKRNVINDIRVSLRENNEEELGKEFLYERVYEDHPYGHLSRGHVNALERIGLDDVRQFYRDHYTRANLVMGLAGNFEEEFVDRLNSDFVALEGGEAPASATHNPDPDPIEGKHVDIIQKETRAVAMSLGFPIDVNRSHSDFAALLVAASHFGQHRSLAGHLFDSVRERRGLNYGTYAYIEYFPDGMYQMQPDPNLARDHQIFQIWVRPVESDNAHFTLRLVKYELDQFIENGLTPDQFESVRNFIQKYAALLTQSQDVRLGYAMDSRYYGIPDFTDFIAQEMQNLTVEAVNQAIRRHLSSDSIRVVMIARNAEELREALISDEPSPVEYSSPPPRHVLDEDEIVRDYPLRISRDNIRIIQVDDVFE